MPLTAGTTLVTDEHVLVPASVVDPVVVTFDGQYVWSFSPHATASARGPAGRWPGRR